MGAPGEPLRPYAARLPLSPVEWACVAFAAIVAFGFFGHELALSVRVGRDPVRTTWRGRSPRAGSSAGLKVRRCGPTAYPLLLSLVVRAAAATGLSFVALLFALQLFAYGAAVLLLRRALAPASPEAARIAFCGLIVNWYVLIYTPAEPDREPVAHAARRRRGVLGADLAQRIRGLARARGQSRRRLGIDGAARQRVPGRGVGIRAWPCCGCGSGRRRFAPRTSRRSRPSASRFPIAPQFVINVGHYGQATPFVTADLGRLQQSLGVQYIKYATALPPVPKAPIPYDNPLLPGTRLDETAPLAWYADYPLRGVATLALHTFNLTDQDLLFTYSRDLRPWYRIPLGIVNHAAVALGVVGLVLLGRRLRATNEPHGRDAWIVLLALIAANWATYVWTAVEMRFGAVLLLVLFPLAGYAVIAVAARGARVRRAVAVGTAAYVVLALGLSGWVRDQAPLIRDADRAGERHAQKDATLRSI